MSAEINTQLTQGLITIKHVFRNKLEGDGFTRLVGFSSWLMHKLFNWKTSTTNDFPLFTREVNEVI